MVKRLLKEQSEYYPKGDVSDMYCEGFLEEDPAQQRRGLVLLFQR